nr:unnamed protein product [Callosobruchus chinensis]
MIGKVRLIFLAAVLAHQIADRASSADKIDDALAKLQKVVDEEVAEANKQLDAAKAQVDAFAGQVQDQAKKAMNSTEEALKKQLDALKEKAKAKGVNIDECLGENEKKLVDLPNVASNDMIHCVTDRVNEGIGYIQTGLNQVKQAADDVATIRQEAKKCGHGFKAIKCIAKLLIKVEEEVVALPKQLKDAVKNVVDLVENLKPRIQACASQKVDEVEAQGKKILEEISICVARKLIGH